MTTSGKLKLEFASTGDSELDTILGGGVPQGTSLVVAGEPGSGKTIFTLQLIFNAAKQGNRALYFTTLSEPAVKVMRYMQLFDFFDAGILDKQVFLADIGGPVRQGPERTLDELARRIDKHQPSLVAIDSFRALAEMLGSGVRTFVYDLAVQMASADVTTLLVGEYAREEISPQFPEFVVVDGILRLGSERRDLTSVRELEILKLRGTPYLSGIHFFDIGQAGLTFYPRVSAPLGIREPSDVGRASSGVEGLDELLGGGFPRGGTTIVQGGTGTGKTVLGLQFLLEGAKRGEKGVLFSLEETPDQLRANGRSLGWDIAAVERQGALVIHYASPVELSTDRFVQQARNIVQATGATRVVFDSLTTMGLGVPSERRFKEMVYALAKHMRAFGVTPLMNLESAQLFGAAQVSGEGVSFIADNLLQLRYVEVEGQLERAISVLKARGIRHETELRSLTIGKGGLHVVAGRFKDMRGVITGLPTRDPGTPP